MCGGGGGGGGGVWGGGGLKIRRERFLKIHRENLWS